VYKCPVIATRTAPRSAELLGIHRARGDACQDCGRELSARLFVVRVRETGEVRHLGRRCAAYATGYPTTRVEHEALRAERARAFEVEVATTWTAEQLADHYRTVVVTYADDTLDAWLPAVDGQPARSHRVPVAEHAVEQLAILRAKHLA
jgi:hypothetical protein